LKEKLKTIGAWILGAGVIAGAAYVGYRVYDQATTPVPEADKTAASSAMQAAKQAAAGTGIKLEGLLYETSDSRFALEEALPDVEVQAAAA
jgi:Na+/H+-translocating membrane pyrophosphatase